MSIVLFIVFCICVGLLIDKYIKGYIPEADRVYPKDYL